MVFLSTQEEKERISGQLVVIFVLWLFRFVAIYIFFKKQFLAFDWFVKPVLNGQLLLSGQLAITRK